MALASLLAQERIATRAAPGTALPPAYIIRLTRVFHIGTLSPADKGTMSYEGSGLSVSVDPSAWQHITPLGGRVWRLSRGGGRFADFHEIRHDADLVARVWAHAESQGYVTRETVYYVHWLDGEDEEETYDLFLDQAEAQEYHDGLEDDERSPRLQAKGDDYIPTPSMGERAQYKGDTLSMRLDFAISFWIEDTQPTLDGVWYEDDYDPYAYSCPRGVIFRAHLDRWTRRDLGPASKVSTFTCQNLGVSSDFNS